MNYSKCTLLITGCMYPSKDVPVVALKDYDVRREQYIASIRYYIEKSPFVNIVYCDNSGAEAENSLTALAEKIGKRFEWLCFSGDESMAIKKGKGYGEGEITSYALNNSRLLGSTEYMVKITGRLIIKNIGLLCAAASEKHVYFQPVITEDGRPYLNTRIYMMPIDCYRRHFMDAYKNVDDLGGTFLEHAFALAAKAADLRYKCFPVYPDYQGISGSTGTKYDLTLFELLKNTIKMYWAKWK